MKKHLLLAACLTLTTAAAAAGGGLAWSRGARAADFPPPPPTTYHGTATGAVAGQKVIALVISGGSATACGDGEVLNDSSAGLVYVVDVVADAQKAGCGKDGRQVQLYFVASGSTPGRLSTSQASWQAPGIRSFNTTPGTTLSRKNYAATVAKDGTY